MEQIKVEMHIEVARAIAAATITVAGMSPEQAKAIICLKRTLRRYVVEHDASVDIARNIAHNAKR